MKIPIQISEKHEMDFEAKPGESNLILLLHRNKPSCENTLAADFLACCFSC